MSTRLSLRVPAAALLALVLACGDDATAPNPSAGRSSLTAAVSDPLEFRQIHPSCGITTADEAWCWGPNGYGQAGDGTTETRLVPVRVAGGHAFNRISAAGGHVCALTTDGVAYCWGGNWVGQLGDGTTTDRGTPGVVAGGLRFKQVAAGAGATCALTTEGLAYCWGANFYGNLGTGTTDPSLTPVPVAGGRRYRQITTNGMSTCAVNLNDVPFCWGDNAGGQLGDGTTEPRLTPTRVKVGDVRFRQVSMGFQHACGVATSEVGYCWGLNEYGRLGNGTYRYSSLTPAKVKGGLKFTSISAADYHTCGIATSGLASCWGFGSYLGGAEVYRSRLPLPVEGGLLWRQLDAGYSTCGVTTSNEGYCWGFNAEGDLGNGGTAFSTTPTPVAPPE